MFEYILREIILSVIAFLAGAGVSAGVFAFVLVIGVVPRILRCSRIENIILIENVMICAVVAVFDIKFVSTQQSMNTTNVRTYGDGFLPSIPITAVAISSPAPVS